ncbi:hypothetical protein CPB84DRAFT_1841850 [Gymnopilus junonius]|uniref:Transmembrane protein n=1 Tax=Gymnopilus junonius TaxID=109634 RepID=A0A9P5TU74_GYMJU|nr:hypothetical protein CPB84DRAFT_1841850 [Gymnopilus junonius]
MSRSVFVDDTDSGIQYIGSWFADTGTQNNLGNFGPPYKSTLHGIKSDGSFSYNFQGTQVVITGTVQFPAPSGATSSNPSWATSANQQTFWFDYIQYTPSASANLGNSDLSITDTDSQISYGSGWQTHSPGQITSQTGSTVSFSFTGTSLTWVGFYDNSLSLSPTTATYSVDGQKPVSFELNGVAAQTSGVQYNQVLFQTPQLSAGKHTIQVVYQGNSQTAPLSLEVLEVQGGSGNTNSGGGSPNTGNTASSTGPSTGPSSSPSATPTSSGASTATSGGSSQATTNKTGTSTGAATANKTGTSTGATTGPSGLPTTPVTGTPQTGASNSNSNSTSSSTKSSNTGAIVGGVIGGLALVVALLIVFLFLRARRKRSKARDSYATVDPFHPAPNPNYPTSNPNLMSQTLIGSGGVLPTAVAFGGSSGIPSSTFNTDGHSVLATGRAEPASPTHTSSTNPYSGYVSPTASEPSNYAASQGVTSTGGLVSPAYASPLPANSKAREAALNQGRYVVNDINHHPAPSGDLNSFVYPRMVPVRNEGYVYPPPPTPPSSKALEAAQEGRYADANHAPGASADLNSSYTRVVRDQDSGLRFPQRVENGQMVEVLPPDYTPA